MSFCNSLSRDLTPLIINSSKFLIISSEELEASAIFIASISALSLLSNPVFGIPIIRFITPFDSIKFSNPSEISRRLSTVKYPAVILSSNASFVAGFITLSSASLGLSYKPSSLI